MKGAVKTEILEREAVKVIQSGDVKAFLKKYRKELTKQKIKDIESIVNIRELYQTVERFVNRKRYSSKAANTFISVAREVIVSHQNNCMISNSIAILSYHGHRHSPAHRLCS